MKGLELSERYYRAHGVPLILEEFRDYAERIAAGLVGDGSECFGLDDAISRDHDWGPGFCIWLVRADYEIVSERLQRALSSLPQTFAGHGSRRVSPWGEGRVGVFEIVRFYGGFTGLDHVPVELNEWMRIPESYLAACTNGKVFSDPLGEFTRWRTELLRFYPEDVRLKKIASRCATIAQSGQYNFHRCLQRGEHFALRYVETQFCYDVISLTFLLNKRYCPFFKWMHRAMKELPFLGESIYSTISELVTTTLERKEAVMQEICHSLIAELQSQGLSDSESTFLLDHGLAVRSMITDKALRQRHIMIG